MTDNITPQTNEPSRISLQCILDKITPSSTDSERFAALFIVCKATSPSDYSSYDFSALFNVIGYDFLFRLCTSNKALYIDISLSLFTLSICSSEISNECQQMHAALISPALFGAIVFLASRDFHEDDFSLIVNSLTTFLTTVSLSEFNFVFNPIKDELFEKLLKKAERGRDLGLYRRFLEVLFILFTTYQNLVLTEKLIPLMINSVLGDEFDFPYLDRLVLIFPKLQVFGKFPNSVLPDILSLISDPLKTMHLEGSNIRSVLRFIHCITSLTDSVDVQWLFQVPQLGSIAFRRMAIEFNILALSNDFDPESDYLVELYRFFIYYICSDEMVPDFVQGMLKGVQDSMVELFDSIEISLDDKLPYWGLVVTRGCLSARFDLFFSYLSEDCQYLKNKGLVKTFERLLLAFCSDYKSVSSLSGEDFVILIDLFNNIIIPGLINAIDDPDFADIYVETGFVVILLEFFIKFCNADQVDRGHLTKYVTGMWNLIDDMILRNMVISQINIPSDILDQIKENVDVLKTSLGDQSAAELIKSLVLYFPITL